MPNTTSGPGLPRDLGAGLLLRRGTAADADALAEFNARLHMSRDATEPDHTIGTWTRDLMQFVHRIAPVLERRLLESAAEGHTGELMLSFYGSGLRLRLEAGRLAEAAAWQPANNQDGDAAFPGLTFLQLLFGYRSLGELRDAFPDCLARSDDARALLQALFPKQASRIWAIN